MRKLRRVLLCAGLLCVVGPLSAALAYNNPSLEWKTIKTEHFEVHYHQGAEWTARQVAEVAEEVHGPLTALYQHEPDVPVHFIIRDTDDYANGATYFYENKIEIWATNLEFGYRGTSQWIRNVVTHEYTHMISIQAAMKMGRRFPAIYFQLITFEKEKRPDVLQGYPRDIVTYPLSGIVFPPWFAEGVSQYQRPGTRYDCWDTHRDMILRCAVLEDKMLSYDAMGFFGKSSAGGEQVYDHGFGLVNDIASQYGPESLRKIADALRAPYRFNADGAFKKATGKSGQQLYGDWKGRLNEKYASQAARIGDVSEGAQLVEAGGKNGYINGWPVFSPDGRQIAYLTNKGSDYAGTDLNLMNRDGTNRKEIVGGASSTPVFSSDGTKILYSRKHKVDRYGSSVNDLFVYDIRGHKEQQLTRGARISDPDFSPDGRMIVGVKNGDGTHRIVLLGADGKNEREIYAGSMGTQFYNPRFSPEGTRILFGIFQRLTRDVALVAADGTGFQYVLQTPNDERDVSWTRDGKGIVFSSDRTGVFNVYELDLESRAVAKRTNVVGGAFNPDESADGALVYSRYSGDGYGIFFVHPAAAPVETLDGTTYAARDVEPFDECAFLKDPSPVSEKPSDEESHAAVDSSRSRLDGEAIDSADSSQTLPGAIAGAPADGSRTAVGVAAPADGAQAAQTGGSGAPAEGSKYTPEYTSFELYPRIVVWDGTPRIGLNVTSDEVLDRQSLLVGGSYGTNGEYDGYLSYEIRNFYPTLFADFIVMRELYQDTGTDEAGISTFYYDLQYDLWQADLGLKFELSDRWSLDDFHQLSAYWSHGEYRVGIEGDEYRYGDYYTSFNGGWKYYIGNEAIVDWTYRKLERAVDSDINPRGGRQIEIQYLRSFDKLFTSGEFEYGFKPKYTDNYFNRYTIDWREYIGLPYLRHSLRMRLYASMVDETVDDFFWIYMGGRDGIRGYTYYSLGAKKGALASLTYRFPIWRNIDQQFVNLYFRDLYGGVFYEAANSWNDDEFPTKGYKNSAGFELRLSLGSYYIFPTAVSWVSAYSIDPVENVLTGFGTIPLVIRQERGWSHYFTLGFTFGL